MKKPDKREIINLFFSAFLIIAYIVCAHFFTQFANTLNNGVGTAISITLYVVFGLLLFYATRVGDGKAVKRFSIPTLVILVVPSLYIIIASIAPGLPLHDILTQQSKELTVIVVLACVALGYGIPYTFLSGFEVEGSGVVAEPAAESSVLEGGVEADLSGSDEAESSDIIEETDSEFEYEVSDPEEA